MLGPVDFLFYKEPGDDSKPDFPSFDGSILFLLM